MPPPPPPSKSYLLVLDDSDLSSSGEDEEYYDNYEELEYNDEQEENPATHYHGHEKEEAEAKVVVPLAKTLTSRTSTGTVSTLSCSTITSRDDNSNDDDSFVPTTTTTSPFSSTNSSSNNNKTAKNKKKKKKPNKNGSKKKKNKKNTKTNTDSDTQVAAAGRNQSDTKSVRFDTVAVREYERCLGTDVVPGDGGWPLGLGHPIVVDADTTATEKTTTVDDYETDKQERLRIRAAVTVHTDCGTLETRQWDYKDGVKNPLFGILGEEQRMKILLASTTTSSGSSIENTSDHHQQQHHNDSHTSPSAKKHNTRSRSNSFSDSGGGPPRGRSNSFAEQYNETFTQVEVHHVRNELEQIRFHRSGDQGHLGCTCRKLDVYLVPADAAAGGKSNHNRRRMSVKRVKEELQKRHLLPKQTKTREELELLLHDAVEREPCCSNISGGTSDCPCARNGVECQADVCSCWYDSHQTKEKQHKSRQLSQNNNNNNKISSDNDNVADVAASRCGNPHGMHSVDVTAIQNLRHTVLDKLGRRQNDDDASYFLCQPVSYNTPPPPSLSLIKPATAAAAAAASEDDMDADMDMENPRSTLGRVAANIHNRIAAVAVAVGSE